MDELKIRRIVQDELNRRSNSSRFNLNTIPFHTHDGVNSPQVKEENLIPSVSVSGNILFATENTYTIYLNSSFTPSQIQLYGVAYSVTGNVTFTLSSAKTVTQGTRYTVSGLTFIVVTTAVNTTSVTMTATGAASPPSTGTLTKVPATGSGNTTLDYTAISDGTSLGIRCQIIGSANLGPSFYLQPSSERAVVTGNIQYPFIDPVLKTTVPLQSSSYVWVQSSNIFKALAGENHIVNVEAGTIYARATITDFTKDKIVIVVSDLEPNWYIQANFIIT